MTCKVVEAWEGRSKVNSRRLFKQYHRGHGLGPAERKNRLKPLNDIYSIVECCLVADAVQFFLDRKIPYLPRCLVEDILNSIKAASKHIQRTVVDNPTLYLGGSKPQLKKTLMKMKSSGKKLFFVRCVFLTFLLFWACSFKKIPTHVTLLFAFLKLLAIHLFGTSMPEWSNLLVLIGVTFLNSLLSLQISLTFTRIMPGHLGKFPLAAVVLSSLR
jgi:hypothetical protein